MFLIGPVLTAGLLFAQADRAAVVSIRTLVNPECSHCRDEEARRRGELKPDDPVLCWIRGYSDGGAIPRRFFLHQYRVISDTYGVFVFDPDAGFAHGFAPSLDFTFHGYRHGVMTMKHKDGTLYSSLTGVAFEGPRKGHRLDRVPTLVSTWGEWLKRYPHAVAYKMHPQYQPVPLPSGADRQSIASRTKPDPRLAPDAGVLGVDETEPRAYPLELLAKSGLLVDGDKEHARVLFFDPATKTAAAYSSVASPPDKVAGAPRPLTFKKAAKPGEFTDQETGSTWDVSGRAFAGPLAKWSLGWQRGVQAKWFAWAAEYPMTSIFEPKDSVAAADRAKAVRKQAREIAGTAEFLRAVPKRWAKLQSWRPQTREVVLLVEGETLAKSWPLVPEAECKVAGWWGRPEDFPAGARVWAWFSLNRQKQPAAVAMIADEQSERDIHGAASSADFEAARDRQRKKMTDRFAREGLPATVSLLHPLSEEMEILVDHEAQRWARSLEPGDKIRLSASPPIAAMVRDVAPWRERTQLRLVVAGTDQTDLKLGGRITLLMPPPKTDVYAADHPPDLDRPRSKDARVEWFLASIYCTCAIGGDLCTGQFYTLSSCNPNGCGMPNHLRGWLAKEIDAGKSDRAIFEKLLAEQGPLLVKPHLKQ
ncbi:MAG TPA: DUF3179 domain-containing (seleno)protein [Planctomycetia bacterium]|nr:DUF3179 domain-containing (seleno)protein [Planctomycetia bacterium]